jgi:hypothetical protein
MKLFNRLIRIDLIFMLAIIILFFIHGGAWKDGVPGCAAALVVISTVNHIRHYRIYKKFY